MQTELNEPVGWSKFIAVEVLSVTDSNSARAINFYCVTFGGGSVAVYLDYAGNGDCAKSGVLEDLVAEELF